ncbi:MAG TPA: cation transporter [Burkholderiales bacterium]|nr:cation transporter [Burkholderiales bacterium]
MFVAGHCCAPASGASVDPRFRRALWIALVVNAVMFAIEIAGGVTADSVSLLADAVDFLGDAANYAVTLFVLALAPVWRSRAALIKGVSMGTYGVFVLAKAGWNAAVGVVPEPITMGAIGILALAANLSVAFMLYAFRHGDANMRSVWLCSRNDAIANVAVILAAVGVVGTGTAWPDLIVASMIALLAIISSRSVLLQALEELPRRRPV